MTDVLVLTAVPAEAAAVLDRFDAATGCRLGPYPGSTVQAGAGLVRVFATGVGPARAAAGAATALALDRPALVVAAGIGGGFAGRAAVGDIVVADQVVHADLGADSPDGYLSMEQLGFGADRVVLRPDLVSLAADRLSPAGTARTGAGSTASIAGRVAGSAGTPVVGPIITVSTVTGTAARAAELATRYRPAAEGMEGAGVWAAAEAHGVPFLEIRAISNPVGRRDRAGWDIPGALAVLGRAVAALLREPLP